ncbi:hypothetical protein MNBD_GAMMA25-2138 [hydrothermal vent metagenome]|uniref:Core-binding (CB) domain-containing protein n=1 Tax=hydrothermal vent metagenome TaxID=652676 RepID=A0A3B1BJX2_9ZZZZ
MTPSIKSKYNHYYSQLCKHLKLKGLQPKTIAAYSHKVKILFLLVGFFRC